jgi:hypothetical protein
MFGPLSFCVVLSCAGREALRRADNSCLSVLCCPVQVERPCDGLITHPGGLAVRRKSIKETVDVEEW